MNILEASYNNYRIPYGTPSLRQYVIWDQITSFVENYLLNKKKDLVIDGNTLLNSPQGESSQV